MESKPKKEEPFFFFTIVYCWQEDKEDKVKT